MQYIAIFGAAVRADGRPSGSLERRVLGALNFRSQNPGARFIVTGGIGRYGPSEAAVMQRLLVEAGIDPDQIIIEDRATDTLESIRFCDRLLRQRGDCESIACCTSRYHQSRCAILFRQLGYVVIVPSMPSDVGAIGLWKLIKYYIKELVATPYDLILLYISKGLPRIRQ